MKHDLTGAGIVLAEEDEAEVREASLTTELNPRSTMGQILIRRLALLSVRMERSADQEMEAVAARSRKAVDAFDRERLDEAERLFDALGEHPRMNLRLLMDSPEGVDRLMEAWQALRDDLGREPKLVWTAAHLERFLNLSGLKIDDFGTADIKALSWAVLGDFANLRPSEGADLDDDARKGWARDQLLERIDAEIRDLRELFETSDFDTIALDRAGAPGRALFDDSPAATRARRYESEASRGFYKAMAEFRKVEAEAAANPGPIATPRPAPTSAPSGSSW